MQLALGYDHTCILLSDGTVRCWGLGADGRLGLGHTESIGDDEAVATTPAVDVGAKVAAIAAGNAHTCALLDTGHLRCWGRGKDGQLGYGRPDNVGDDETPASVGDVPLTEMVTAIAAGGDSTCVLLTSGSVRCWGDNQQHRLGYEYILAQDLGDNELVESWKPFTFERKVVQLAANVAGTCVLFSDRAVHCWGVLLGSVEDPAEAGKVPDVDIGAPVSRLSLMPTSGDGCVITSDDHARCWGADDGTGYDPGSDVGIHSSEGDSPAKVGDVPVAGRIHAIAAGSDHGCVLLAGGPVKCWGERRLGILGTPPGDYILAKDAVAVAVGAPAVTLAVSHFHSCVITDRGGVRCWGYGKDGRLGYGSTENIGDKRPPSAAGDVIPLN